VTERASERVKPKVAMSVLLVVEVEPGTPLTSQLPAALQLPFEFTFQFDDAAWSEGLIERQARMITADAVITEQLRGAQRADREREFMGGK